VCVTLSSIICRNPLDYNSCLDLTKENLNCIATGINNGECKEISANECRGKNN
jgi:hypothetical protein